MSRLTRAGTVEPVSRYHILRRERGQGNIHFSCSADHVQDWQPYPVDPYSYYMCDHTYAIANPLRGHKEDINHIYTMLPILYVVKNICASYEGQRVTAADTFNMSTSYQ